MSSLHVPVRELAAWGFDSYDYRPKNLIQPLARSHLFEACPVPLVPGTEELHALLALQAQRPDLLAEMSGLSWSLGVVDLRPLLAFQRRLAFDPEQPSLTIPQPGDWTGLTDLCFGPSKPVVARSTQDALTGTLTIQSSNPNVHLRASSDLTAPLILHAGGPFVEVACYRERWFLRDGYHRAYALLQSGISQVPAVIVQASTLEELGADRSWFFSEEILFSSSPPRVVDFLNDAMVVEYRRPVLLKTITITMRETITPAPQGNPT